MLKPLKETINNNSESKKIQGKEQTLDSSVIKVVHTNADIEIKTKI